MLAYYAGIFLNPFAIDNLERGESLRHGDRVAAEGIEMNSIGHGLGDIRPGYASAKRNAVADPLGHGDQVGTHPPVLKAPEMFAGAAKAGLYFVGNAQAAEAMDDVVNDLEI